MKYDNAKDWWNSIYDSREVYVLMDCIAGTEWDELQLNKRDDVTWLFESLRG
jgi:hypothetical protein